MNASQIKDGLVIAAVLGGAYLVYRTVGKAAEAVDAVYSGAVNKTADALYSVFGPDISGTNYYYTVNFAGGVKHSIPRYSADNHDGVNNAGQFTYNGKRFVIRDKKLPGGAIEHWAFSA